MATQSDTKIQERKSGKTAPARLLRLVIRGLLALLILVLILFFIVLPVGFGVAATTMPHQAVGSAPEGFENVKLVTTDGDPLAAWYAGPQNGAVIVLAHGASNSRESMRPYAQMLMKHGFGVLAYDQRGQGESGGQTNLYGWEGEGDVAAVMQFLSAQKDVKAIGGLGLSLGGEVLLGAASANPAMKAIVGEGATRRSLADVRALPSHANPIQWLQPWVTYATVHLLTGNAPPTAIVDSIKGAPLTHFLLIAAQDVKDEVEFAGIFADAALGRAEVWAIPTGGHTGGFGNHPEEYELRVIKFFKEALLKE